jgi:uracil-DNA glycosylase family 4
VIAAPSPDCPLCPRLAAFRAANRAAQPGWFNAPVPSFGPERPHLLIVGLAPGLKGANRTGRPFTGDGAGELLYPTLLKFGWARGTYRAAPDDGVELLGCRIVNAVRCVPPENKPTGSEIGTCRQFLKPELDALADGSIVVALGKIAHDSILLASGRRIASAKFGHGNRHPLDRGISLRDSFHCSRYNTSTGKLTPAMFEAVFAAIPRS